MDRKKILIIVILWFILLSTLGRNNIENELEEKKEAKILNYLNYSWMKNPNINLVSKIILSKIPLLFWSIFDLIIIYYLFFPIKRELKKLDVSGDQIFKNKNIINDIKNLNPNELTQKYKNEINRFDVLKKNHDEFLNISNFYKYNINILVNNNIFKNLFAISIIMLFSSFNDLYTDEFNNINIIIFIYIELIFSYYFFTNGLISLYKFKNINNTRKYILTLIICGKIYSKSYDSYYLTKTIINLNKIIISISISLILILAIELLNKKSSKAKNKIKKILELKVKIC